MKITFIIKKTAKRYDTESSATIYLRLRDGRRLDSVVPTELTINPNLWDDKGECVKTKVVCNDELRANINYEILHLREFIEKEYSTDKENVTKEWLKIAIDKYYNPKKYAIKEEVQSYSFKQLFDEFLEKHPLSEVRKKNFRVVKRTVMRFELFIQKTKRGNKDFTFDINEVSKETLQDLWSFFENEYKYFEKYPKIYEAIPEKRTPKPRGKNTIIDSFSRLRTFFIWCYNQEKTQNRPFDKFPIEECLYGTPIYITIEERNQIFNTDLSKTPKLAIQRDIFVFQSVIGCRIGDLYKMTKRNVVNGAIEYIQSKTKEDNPRTLRVPLNETAKTILARYKDYDGESLFPFVAEQHYNKAIKEFFELAGIDRIVTHIDPLTRQQIQSPLYEVATSHTARKTFAGNMYKKVKDPDLVSSMSGHKEGSKAFRRYRDIDEEMKQDLVKLLD